MTPLHRFWSKISVDPTTGCWHWRAHVLPTGYGMFKLDGKMRRAHRVAYELFVGEVPEGLELDHTCKTRDCVNPSHLEPVTHLENMRRGHNATKTHCPHGHPYDEENTYRDAQGRRYCRACNRAAARRRAAA